ncbi:unnamed protein product [Scytosiphon promiscuus]
MLGRGSFEDFFRTGSQEFSPVGLLTLSMLFGAIARSYHERRRYNRFEAKLAAIEAQRGMVALPTSNASDWSSQRNPLSSPGACPICLDVFTAAGSVEGGGSGGLVGADGLPTVTADCGHTFCRSCLSRWHGDGGPTNSSRASHAHNDEADPSPSCPICDSPTPALGDPRLGRPRRRGPRRRPNPRPSRRPARRKGLFGFRWPGSSYSAGGMRTGSTASPGRFSGISFRFPRAPGSSGGGKTMAAAAAAQGMLPSPITPPPPPPPPPPRQTTTTATVPPPPSTPRPPPPPPPPPTREIGPPGAGGTPSGAQQKLGLAAAVASARRGSMRATGGEQARERARREAAFRLASLGSQYPKLLDGRTVNRWLSKDYASDWSRDPLLGMNQIDGAPGGHGAGMRKGSGWASRRSSGFVGGGGGGERRSYGGGSSSSATGGGW